MNSSEQERLSAEKGAEAGAAVNQKMSELATEVQDKAGEAWNAVQEAARIGVQQTGEKGSGQQGTWEAMKDKAGEAANRLSEAGTAAKHRVKEATDTVDHKVDEAGVSFQEEKAGKKD